MRYSLLGGIKQTAQKRTTKFITILAVAVLGLGSGLTLALAKAVFASPGSANVYVSPTASGLGDCSSWANACDSLNTAMAVVSPNGTVHLAAGTFNDYFTINKSIAIEGAGEASTTVSAPVDLPSAASDGSIITVSGNSVNAAISDLTVSGPGPSGLGSIFAGIYVKDGANANLHDMAVAEISDNPLSGAQSGIGIQIGRNSEGTTGTATINNVTVSGFQKNGITVDNTGSYASIKNSTITGSGPLGLGYAAQNGIQVSRGANSVIENDTITGSIYTPNTWSSTGILLYNDGGKTTIKNDTITDNFVGLYIYSPGSLSRISLAGISGNTYDTFAAVPYNPGAWPKPTTTYADAALPTITADNSDTLVTTYGHTHVLSYDAFPTIQGAIDGVATNGHVYVANDIYNENLNINKSGLKIYGQSQAGTILNSTRGYGVDIEQQDHTRLSDFTFNTSGSNLFALHAYGINGLSLNNLTFNGPGKTTESVGGVDVNSSQNVSYNNVSASNYSKNGFSVTAENSSTDNYSRNLTFNGITANNNGWNGLAFYTTNKDGSAGHNITGVQFKGTNTITNNGGNLPLQGGVFIEGDNDNNLFSFALSGGNSGQPRYTVTTSHGVLNLGSTNFSSNNPDITNYQADDVNALTATFGGLTGNQMTAAQRQTEDGLIYDQVDSSALGLVQYFDTPAQPGVTMANANGKNINNNGYITTKDFTFALTNNPSDDATRYQLKYWNNISGSPYNGETHAWSPTNLSATGHMATLGTYIDSFTQGEGTHYFEFSACNAAGKCSAFTSPFTVTFDNSAPTASFTNLQDGEAVRTVANLTVKGTYQEVGPAGINRIVLYVSPGNGYDYTWNQNYHNNFGGEAYHFATIVKTGDHGTFSYTFTAATLHNLGVSTGGQFTVTAVPIDNAGNGQASRFNVVLNVDNTAPIASFTSPNSGSYINSNNSLAVTGKYHDDGPAGIDRVMLYLSKGSTYDYNWNYNYHNTHPGYSYHYALGVVKGNADGTFNYTFTPAQLQELGVTTGDQLTVTAVPIDQAGNGQDSRFNLTLNVDNTPPADPVLVGPKDGAVVNGKSITQSWSDSSSDVDHYIYQSYSDQAMKHLRFTTTYTTTSKTATNVAETTYWWRVMAVDKAGNDSGWSQLWEITVDNTAPAVNITSPANGALVRGSVNINGTITDANPDHYYLVVKNSHGQIVAGPHTVNQPLTSFTYAWDTTKLSDGNYTIDLEARDAAGNKGPASTQTISVTVDNTAPNAPTANPAGENHTGSLQVTLSATDNTGGSGIDAIYFTTDGSTPDSSSTKYISPITVSVDTTIKAIAYDKAGNASPVMSETYGIAPVISGEGTLNPTTNSVTLVWTTNQPATSRVIYDTAPHNSLGSAPNYGYAFSTTEDSTKVTSHSVTITGLTPGTTYYFRTVSHGSPESVSPEVTGVTQVPSTNGNPTFQVAFANPQVQGTNTGNSNNPQPKVLGAQTSNSSGNSGNFADTVTPQKASSAFLVLGWWWLAVLAAILAVLYWLVSRRSGSDQKA